ncbi:hypothetical protein KDA_60550 [Dictyobacter alpinus]|uniref:Transposase IS701-like DDE domain-containing protein n=1 Tax=Dictyobacter alpinus TaxID=2014873 RepID=A0A402BE06_9CHLR|nr:NF041680 family putative transposase [Dictyobacter alpinus]GCE26746.1 hypothetical protein KDA_22300 [Dictyobacter alpinus]GCE29405.1 hypothetical protein KDA_48890 [Dictyobacter alpinus]GCE29536.1 hypothetical protein KDA_50200 [Dictyobacter alpinus]GCE30571.1 hypothetical protein KDA_60550 [Dictyobacter alpinus]
MNLNTLRRFRHEIYDCCERAKDALFTTMDALITQTQARSLPELSQDPRFQRHWSSVYEAFEDGRIDRKRLQEVFVRYLPAPPQGRRLWIGIDASSIARPAARTSADRTAQPVHNLPKSKQAITYGWQFSTVVALPEQPSSWTYLLDQQRIASSTTAIELAFTQLSELAPQLPVHSIAALDRGYDSTWLWCRCSTLPVGVLGRLKCNRRFYRPAPPPTGKRGAPCKDGAILQPKDEATHGEPDGKAECTDLKGRPVEISWWKHLHVKEARWLELSVMRVLRPHATNQERDPRISWFVWIGDPNADLADIALGYARRFGQEHGYRFDKQALLWEKPRLRTPEQFERWSQVVAMAHNHVVVGRDLVQAHLHPWENKQRPPTPQQVRRGFSKLLVCLGTPARSPQARGKAKGRIKGATIRKAKRYAPVRKTPKVPQLVPS